VAPPEIYYDRLIGLATGGIDLWETEYLHILSGPEKGESAVLSWVRGTALRPLLAPLEQAEQAEFAKRYDAKLQRAYPRRTDGKTLFPFRRLFLVARG
jgi:trans-aconitate 2-methyltransferase